MSSSRPALARWAAFGGLLLLGMLVVGLVAMHGVQASGPEGMSGVPVISMSDMHSAPDQQPLSPMPGHHHPGGQVCLGLLVLAIALALTCIGLTAGTTARAGPAGRPIRTLLLLVGRPPPSIYQLAVLRL